MIRKLLIANRGEIAVRILRTARELGIRTVAVYSDPDQNSLHSKLADEAIPLGGSMSSESYLNLQKLIQAARDSDSDALHPGYGFLSEREQLAEACEKNKITFIGPPASAMRQLGSKIEAKNLADSLGIPLIPGFFKPRISENDLLKAAERIGFPVMLKAAAGGGGRGMRIVEHKKDFLSTLKMASEEALRAFGDGTMMVEKLIKNPRHIEVQVLSDTHGNTISLFERECSIQRRYQKLIEESPSVVFSEQRPHNLLSLWPQMNDAAIKLMQAGGYQNAGTVEFIVDEQEGKFYFLEVNTRLQVEHPITEAVMGIDLVQAQLQIANGQSLNEILPYHTNCRHALRGHAIEARIIAENPSKNFMPSVGTILGWAKPEGPGIRVDTGYEKGMRVSEFYDSLLAKVIVHAETREKAIQKLKGALEDFHILGIQTNIPYLLDVLNHPKFIAGHLDIGFLEREFKEWKEPETYPEFLYDLYETAQKTSTENYLKRTPEEQQLENAWGLVDGWKNTWYSRRDSNPRSSP